MKTTILFWRLLIDNDKIIIKKETMSKLSQLFDGKISVVSGRSKLAVEYSLETISEYINIGACVFLEDEVTRIMPNLVHTPCIGLQRCYLLKARYMSEIHWKIY